MIDLDIFGRGEIKRLGYELKQLDFKKQELENEVECLRRVEASQRTTIEYLLKELRAADAEHRQREESERKLWSMYNASEAARRSLAARLTAREKEAGKTDCHVADTPRNDRREPA